jgi:hypothetical protein
MPAIAREVALPIELAAVVVPVVTLLLAYLWLQRAARVSARSPKQRIAVLGLAAITGAFWGGALAQPIASGASVKTPAVHLLVEPSGPTRLPRAVLVATTAPSTTVTLPVTTTAPSTTTSTVPPTTTTTVPPSTQPPRTTVPRTSTTVPPTSSTTTLPVTTTSGSSTPWPWIVAVLAFLVVLGIGIYLLMRRSRRRRVFALWRRSAAVDLDAARTARALLPTAVVAITDDDQWIAVQQRVEDVARSLERAAGSAPTDDLRVVTQTVAYRFRSLVAALEAARLLHRTTPSPSAESLMTADDSVRSRWAELDEAFDRVAQVVAPPHA